MPGDDQGAIDIDEMFSLLSDNRRRYVLYELREAEYFELEELARIVTEREADDAANGVSDERTRRVAVSLHHHQLPRLTAARMIEYDPRHGDIRAQSLPSRLERCIDFARALEFDTPYPRATEH